MQYGLKKQITRAQYERALENNRYVAKQDMESIFTPAELLGYGVYSPIVYEDGGSYFVGYVLGSSCD